ncbi:MAG TPA: phage baseplate assembly protein V [Allosphingosinicella sp.]|nr:phage baseplate assembly protein V [Allosphingosinicella sp.]
MSAGPFFGKYRGKVVNNIDPKMIGRILVSVPDVGGSTPLSWAMPCLPLSGINAGFFTVPAIGSGVWVEFERGDPGHPIWVGGYWGSAAEVPTYAKTLPPGVAAITLQTAGLNGLVISDVPGPLGGIIIKNKTKAQISVNEIGITIENGLGAKIELIGPQIKLNGTALTVT